MCLLPLVERELKEALRRPATRRVRLFCGGGSLVLVAWSFLVWGSSSGFGGGRAFDIAAVTASCATICAAIFLAADSISFERREGTLAFLFLTDLKARDIVLGKLAATGLVPGFALMSIFPALAVCPPLGGMLAAELWRGVLILLVTLIYSFSVTLLVSSFCKERREATFIATLFLLVANPLWLWVLAWRFPPILFWSALFSLTAFAAGSIAATAAVLDRIWRDKEVVRSSGQKPKPQQVQTLRRVRGEVPIAWMMLRRKNVSGLLRGLLYLSVGAGALYLTRHLLNRHEQASSLVVLLLIHLAVLFVLLGRTGYSFFSDRQDGSLELLLGTRLTNEEIFSGFAKFLLDQSRLFLTFLTALDVLFSVLLLLSPAPQLCVLPVAMAATLWVNFFGVRWLGVYRSLVINHPSLTILGTFARLCAGPLALSALCLTTPRTDIFKVAVFWVGSSAFLTLLFGNDARAALMQYGRTLLLRPYAEKPPHVENEWSFINWDDVLEENMPRLVISRKE